MNQNMIRPSIFLLCAIAAVAIACSTSHLPEVSSQNVTKISEPLQLITPTMMATRLPTKTPTSQPIQTLPPIVEPKIAQAPTVTPLPLSTATPTIPEIDLKGTDLENFGEGNYDVLQSAPITTKDGSYYFAYILQDDQLNLMDVNSTTSQEVCRIAFFSWQSEVSVYLGSFPAPVYPKSVNEAYPVDCVLIDWDQSFTIDPFLAYAPLWPTIQSEDTKEILNLESISSDINNNGLPEFAVAYQYCKNACWNWGIIATHFYEIQSDSSIVDITADLPGAVVPFFNLVHDDQSGTLYVYDRGYVGPGSTVDSYWIFSWQDGKYEDTTPQFADDILAWGSDWLAEVQLEYGKSLEWLPYDFGRILHQYEKAGLQDEAIAMLSEISNPANWPESDIYNLCYLRLVYENAILDRQNNRPFSLPPNIVGFGSAKLPSQCKDLETTK